MALRLSGYLIKRSEAGDLERIPLVTRDISVGGFYALCEEKFSRNERLVCVLDVAPGALPSQEPLHLHCTVRVVRVEPEGDWPRRFGVGLEIEEYHVLRDPV